MVAVEPVPPVLIFDSGVGGLSVAAEIRRRSPGLRLAYVADTACFPYGEQAAEFLIDRVCRVVAALVAVERPSLVVVACNTASTIALPALRAMLDIPVVGVVPAIKPAASLSRRRVIGLLGTHRTVAAEYTARLVADFAPDCRLVAVGSPRLVRQAEAHLHGEAIDRDLVAHELAPFRADDPPDIVVLACTHFPLLRPALEAALPPDVTVIDSGAAIARRVAQLVAGLPISPDPISAFHLTSAPADGAAARRAFASFGFVPGAVLPVPR